jgi:hypothetical protein
MNRKQVRAILANAEIDDAEKISQILAIYHDETEGLKTSDDVKTAVAEALKNVPAAAKVEDSEEYKKLKQELEDFKYSTDVKGKLKDGKVKDKFIDDVLAKIKRDGKLEEQLPQIKEQYGENFDDDGTPPPEQKTNKPVFSTDPKNQQQPPEKKPIPKIF